MFMGLLMIGRPVSSRPWPNGQGRAGERHQWCVPPDRHKRGTHAPHNAARLKVETEALSVTVEQLGLNGRVARRRLGPLLGAAALGVLRPRQKERAILDTCSADFLQQMLICATMREILGSQLRDFSMLIEFSVSNFRSFRERQTLSMVAATRLGRKENTFSPDLVGEKFPDLLKAVAIYGPNASGKSNLLRALDVVVKIANRAPTPHLVPLPVAPFGFDPALANRPSVFEFHFIRSGLRYSYELAATSARIVRERLASYPRGKETLIYERQFDGHVESYSFGQPLMAEVNGDVTDAWTRLTSPAVLFIAQAVANSSGDMQVLRAPFEWLSDSSMSLMNGMKSMALSAQNLVYKGHGTDEISAFLRELDVPVSKVTVEPMDEELLDLDIARPNQQTPRSLGSATLPRSRRALARYRTTLTHRAALGEADIAYDDESEGTKNLFGFWLPWITRDMGRDHARCLLEVDEIDSSLHPKIVEALVARHLSAPQVSQLIFTTHDTHLMDSKLLRRDQIWITERDANGATKLWSIHDFKGRQSEDIEKRYFEGRYRGLPLTTKG
jgi:energy-coupling factor transporter ATP-binding protein EcfA2